ncbi:hypothetical protein HMPREF9713_00194 [Myroides odoratimimus CCUG 12700]|uniref:hypothetical protein n=1 Tax=Myroides odoratimimus TaxID=76832 RepID=UPI0003534064|nr:hypothetical protein [Myroides odoratimimus]EPH13994.1 hypothetical protein HMPREF9713_00194 [Myroides odoratimimus CCUG 12700]
MNNKIIVLIALIVTSFVYGQQARTFPYFLPLTGDDKPSVITEYFGRDVFEKSERYSEDGLALTFKTSDGKTQEFSGFALDEIPFTSEFGIIVEFKYAMIDGEKFNNRYGDGMTMFLYDSDKTFEIGGHGASLGYTYRNSDYANSDVKGLNGGYLAVGLDVYGDFKARSVAYGEKKEGIDKYDWSEVGSHVTVRGGQYLNDRYKGYPVLYTINANKQWEINRGRLEYDTGDYDFREDNFSKRFEMYTGHDNHGNIKYNTVIVTVFPDNDRGGSYVQVKVMDDKGDENKNVIDRFFYPNEFKTRDQNGKLYDFKTKVPDNFKIGFAAATGGAYEKHLIKNVKVSLPYEPETEDVIVDMCSGNTDGKRVNMAPYKEAWFYSGPVNNPRGGNDKKYINYDSFRFEDEKGYALNSSNHFKYTQSGVGVWEYDSTKGEVTFEATENLPDGEYSVYFSATGQNNGPGGFGPFGREEYRSRPTKLTVEVKGCKVFFNPNQPIKVRVK